jgi:mono/diheme cytochrome c family protein
MTSGCVTRIDMHEQPKVRPLRENDFYADRRGSRPVIEGTVARGQLKEDSAFYTGKVNGQYVAEFPFPVTAEVLDRGRERFNVFCAPCHSRVGDGNGMIVQRGFKRPPSYHIDRLRQKPVGYFFDVATNGMGSMAEYASQVPPRDRWAIVAYIRALQLSQNATRGDVPAGMTVSGNPPDLSAKPAHEAEGQRGGNPTK